MSWSSYVDNLDSQGLRYSAIVGLNDNQIWAKSEQFNFTPAEAATIVAGSKNASNFQASGIHAGGTKYYFLRSQGSPGEEMIVGKKGSDEGIVFFLSKTCLVLGVYEISKLQPGEAATVVGKIRDYLSSAGY